MIKNLARKDGISRFIIKCDECGQFEYYACVNFKQFINEATGNGWKIVDEEGREHVCPSCVVIEENQGNHEI